MFPLRGFVLNCGTMEIGDLVTYHGKSYVLRGLEPMSVPDRRAELEDAESGELVSVPVDLLDEAQEAAGLSCEP